MECNSILSQKVEESVSVAALTRKLRIFLFELFAYMEECNRDFKSWILSLPEITLYFMEVVKVTLFPSI
jgi:hypothetical protein